MRWHGHPGDGLRYAAIWAGTPANQQERSDLLSISGKDRYALVDSTRVRIEIAAYRKHGQDAHATLIKHHSYAPETVVHHSDSFLDGQSGLIGQRIRDFSRPSRSVDSNWDAETIGVETGKPPHSGNADIIERVTHSTSFGPAFGQKMGKALRRVSE